MTIYALKWSNWSTDLNEWMNELIDFWWMNRECRVLYCLFVNNSVLRFVANLLIGRISSNLKKNIFFYLAVNVRVGKISFVLFKSCQFKTKAPKKLKRKFLKKIWEHKHSQISQRRIFTFLKKFTDINFCK